MTKSLYQDFFGIRENPFSIIPDPHYLYMGPRHQEALAHLLFGVGEGGGFVLLTGEVGTGKTTVCRALAEQLPEKADLALILNPKLGELELMAAICDEMHIAYPEDTNNLKVFFDALNLHLLDAHSRGRSPVLLIDEAQALPEESIELVRLLTNLETAEKKLLQIILVGQPELNSILAKQKFRQTAQRITARYHLDALGLADCKKYIDHRLRVAGMNETVFSAGAIRVIKKSSGGIPRLINSICDRALLGAYAEGVKKINRKIANRSAGEVLGRGATPNSSSVWFIGSLVLGVAIFAIIFEIDPTGYGFKEKSSTYIDSMLAENKLDFSALSLDRKTNTPIKNTPPAFATTNVENTTNEITAEKATKEIADTEISKTNVV
ncbi:MAG: AAA family ATPase, partial [Rhodospirillaceae bacterium]|nr:AAA family ATPase [Rhodospirillaceae bacterium]